jgi:curved DNA-binding protein CbpA
MKPFEEQSYYELLEILPTASPEEIRAAYKRQLELYEPDSVAVYSLGDPAAVDALRARLLEAMEILTEPDLRIEYDRSIGVPAASPAPAAAAVAPQAVRSSEEPAPATQLSMVDVLRGAETRHSTHPEIAISYIPHPSRTGGIEALAGPLPGPPDEPLPSVEPRLEPGGSLLPPQSSRSGDDERRDTPVDGIPQIGDEGIVPPPMNSSSVQRSSRNLEHASELSQESAIATAEVAMAQVSAQVAQRSRDGRPKLPELSAETEYNGELLRQLRASKGLTLQQLADRTRISSRHLENVEADRYEGLPATVYLRGILMNISRELGVDPLRVSRSYLALAASGKKDK